VCCLLSLIYFSPACSFLSAKFKNAVACKPSGQEFHLTRQRCRNGVASLMAKKGKPNRGNPAFSGPRINPQEQALMAQREMLKDGLPVFQVYVRSKISQIWFPLAALKGDQRAQSLVNAYMSGFLTDLYKNNLETGIAKSVMQQRDSLCEQVPKNVPPLKKTEKSNLEFGFKILYEGLEEKMGPQKVQLITEEMSLNIVDKVKKNLGF